LCNCLWFKVKKCIKISIMHQHKIVIFFLV
jgi:hypothetical protein